MLSLLWQALSLDTGIVRSEDGLHGNLRDADAIISGHDLYCRKQADPWLVTNTNIHFWKIATPRRQKANLWRQEASK